MIHVQLAAHDALFGPLEHSDDTSYVLSETLQIVSTNAAWTMFARANGGEQLLARWGPGASVLEAVPAVLREFYRAGFARTFETATPWLHDYECSSPELHRRFRMVAYPTAGFIVVTHSLRVAHPHDLPASAAELGAYEQDGVLRMCSHCRRMHHREASERWDWVPGFVARMPANVSHGLCPPCAAFYYGDHVFAP